MEKSERGSKLKSELGELENEMYNLCRRQQGLKESEPTTKEGEEEKERLIKLLHEEHSELKIKLDVKRVQVIAEFGSLPEQA